MDGIPRITDRPDLYDWLYDDFSDDIPMYLKLAAPHQRVLECGIGTGRIGIPLAKSGKDVYGLDYSSAMINQLKTKISGLPNEIRDRIHLFHEDMRNFDLKESFSFIFIPFSTFNYLLRLDDQKNCIRSVYNHLEPSGTFVLELLSYSLYPYWFTNDSILRKYSEKRDPNTGQVIQLWKLGGFNSASQLITEERHFRFYSPDGKFIREEVVYWENRFFFLGEIELLLQQNGFRLANVFGNFNFEPYQHSSPVAIIVAESK